MLSLNNLKPSEGSTKKRKRVGRGNSSGHGTYSGRGLKGQKARSGVSGLKRLGMKSSLLQIPKKRGFKSSKSKNQPVNIIDLNENFKDGEEINPKILLKKGLVRDTQLPIKILGKGELKIKNIVVSGIEKISKNAEEQIKKQGGQIK